ncbi:pyrimidodiazepine synthase-like [Onthophagus taurus]|uniref:pyrimidodiazepine synthase-like n=1 Tax=Onthophagus taurus TaxID=166361 RepID=UPI0039BDEFC7
MLILNKLTILRDKTYHFQSVIHLNRNLYKKSIQPKPVFFNKVKVTSHSSCRHKINSFSTISKMSLKHLGAGSECPPKSDEKKLRLYSMEYCPFVHRVRLVLRAKNLDFETVNINLINKPEWLFKLHPEGKVPALEIGDKVIVESLDICNYLDQEYPNPPLYPSDPTQKEKDIALFDVIGKLHGNFIDLVLKKETKTPQEWKNIFMPNLTKLNDELKQRGTTYFGGETPGMLDYVLWPWAERAGTVVIVLGEKLPLESNELEVIRKWRKTMQEHPVVAGIYHGPEKFYKSVQIKVGELPPDYDAI